MLFVSRYIRSEGAQDSFGNTLPVYGVVDTDDNIENVVPWSIISDVTCKLGLEIHGVKLETMNGIDYVKSVTPYQPGDTITKLQSKTATLSRVKITTWNNWISMIQFDKDVCEAPPTIRLSDFGTRVADFVLCDIDLMPKHSVTLVLDDNIYFNSTSFAVNMPMFSGFETLGIVYDVRELSDPLADMLYRMLFTSLPGAGDLRKSVIDKPDRLHKMMMLFYGRSNGCCL